MVGDDLLLPLGDDHALALLAGESHVHAVLEILLGHGVAAGADGTEGRLVDDVGKIRAARPRGDPGDGAKNTKAKAS